MQSLIQKFVLFNTLRQYRNAFWSMERRLQRELSSSSKLQNAKSSITLHRTKLTFKCWKSHPFMMLVAILGKIPRFFCLRLSFSSSSSLNIESSESGMVSDDTPLFRSGGKEKVKHAKEIVHKNKERINDS